MTTISQADRDRDRDRLRRGHPAQLGYVVVRVTDGVTPPIVFVTRTPMGAVERAVLLTPALPEATVTRPNTNVSRGLASLVELLDDPATVIDPD